MTPVRHTYAALTTGARASGEPVILAVRRHPDPEQRRVVALTEPEARLLHGEGRLTGWEPGPDPAGVRAVTPQGPGRRAA